MAVESLAPVLAFRTFVPDELPSAALERVSLGATPSPRGQPSDVLGDPMLLIQWSVVAGGKPALTLLEGPADCCAGALTPGDRTPVVIRPARAGTPELRGELIKPRSAIEGTIVSWHESLAGARTFIALIGTSFAQLDDSALLRIAASMRPIEAKGRSDAVLLYFSTHVSHSPDGHRLFVAAKTRPLPEEARLLDANGAVVATAAFTSSPSWGCLISAAGVAALAVPHDVVENFGRTLGAVYRVEARVNGRWRLVQPVAGGCSSTE
jgi:hypothetical protein